jgi:16S rRNA (adenine1518-N6/adenine1519-N6)-dimethyltransferase
MVTRARPLTEDLAALQAVLTPAFGQRRKMLRSTLIPWLRERGVDAANLDGECRAEEIGVAQYCALAGQLRSISSIL